MENEATYLTTDNIYHFDNYLYILIIQILKDLLLLGIDYLLCIYIHHNLYNNNNIYTL